MSGNLCATRPSKRLSLYHPPPLHQPRANTTIPLHLTTLHPPTLHPSNPPPSSNSSNKCRRNGATPSMHPGNIGPSHAPEPTSAGASPCTTNTNSHLCS